MLRFIRDRARQALPCRSLPCRSLPIGALCTVAIILAAEAQAQRDAGRGAGAGYGQSSAGYGQSSASSVPRGGEGRGGAQATGGRVEPIKFPERRSSPAGGQLAEYQKPTYDHHRLALSPDGTKMALSGRHLEMEPSAGGDQPAKIKRDRSNKPIVTENVVEVIDVGTGRSLVAFKPPMLFDNLALSPDNRFLAAEAGARAGSVFALHLPSRKSKQFDTGLRRILPGGLAFAKDGRSIHVLAADRLKTIDLAKGEAKELKFELASPAASYCAELNLVAVGVSRSKEGKPEVQIYDVGKQSQSKQLAVPAGPTSLQFSADGKFLAVTVAGGAVGVWQTSDWARVGSVTGQIGYDAGPLAVSADGQLVAVQPRTGRGETRIIDISSSDRRQSIATRDAVFLPAGDLAVASANGPFYLNISSGTLTELPAGAAADPTSAEATALAVQGSGAADTGYGSVNSAGATSPAATVGYGASSADIARAATPQVGYGASSVEAAQAAAPQVGYGTPSAPQTTVGYGAVSTANNPTQVGAPEPDLTPADLSASGGSAHDFSAKTRGAGSIAVSPSGRKLALSHVHEEEGARIVAKVTVWDLSSGKQLHEFTGDADYRTLAFSPQEDYLAASIYQRTPTADGRLWELASGKDKVFPLSEGTVFGQIAFTADGKAAVTMHLAYFKLSPVGDGEPQQIKSVEPLMRTAFCTPRNELVGVAVFAGAGQPYSNLSVYTLPAAKPQRTMKLPGTVTSVGYSPDGNRFAVGLQGGQIIVYDTPKWTETLKFDGAQSAGYSDISVSNDGQFVAAKSGERGNNTLMVWKTADGAMVKSEPTWDHAFLPGGILVRSMADGVGVTFHDLENNRDVIPWAKEDAATAVAGRSSAAPASKSTSAAARPATSGYGVPSVPQNPVSAPPPDSGYGVPSVPQNKPEPPPPEQSGDSVPLAPTEQSGRR